MQYFSEKVIEVNNKLYTCIEKTPAVYDNRHIVILRQVEKVSKTYTHPVKGPNTQLWFEKVPRQPKVYIPESDWDLLPDRNVDNLRIE